MAPAPGGSVPEEETEEKAVDLTPYVGAVSQAYPYRIYGLMTTEGEIVTEAECSELYLAGYSGTLREDETVVPVWKRYK